MHRKLLCALPIVLLACGADAGAPIEEVASGNVEAIDDAESAEREATVEVDEAMAELADELGTAEQAQSAQLQGCFDSANECIGFAALLPLQLPGINCTCVLGDAACPLEAVIGARCSF